MYGNYAVKDEYVIYFRCDIFGGPVALRRTEAKADEFDATTKWALAFIIQELSKAPISVIIDDLRNRFGIRDFRDIYVKIPKGSEWYDMGDDSDQKMMIAAIINFPLNLYSIDEIEVEHWVENSGTKVSLDDFRDLDWKEHIKFN